MKILTIHADFIEFQATRKALKQAAEASKEAQRVEECLVVLTAVEKRDEKQVPETAARYVQEIKNIAQQVNAKKIVLYPYAHLSSQLAAPNQAEEVLKTAEALLKQQKFQVTRAPFGWYKSFTLACKGHPLSELSREFAVGDKRDEKEVAGSREMQQQGKMLAEDSEAPGSRSAAVPSKEEVSEALKAEEKLASNWFILDVEGRLHPVSYDKDKKKFSGYEFKDDKSPEDKKHIDSLRKLAAYELAKDRRVLEEPPHVKYMRKLELVDYEPGSDPGNLRLYPKGRLIKSLIERWVTQQVKEYGGMEIEAPIMYDIEHPSLKSYLHRFPARQYTIQTPNKKVFLRFAACFGQFLQAHDAQISYKQLPVRLYELTRYSFRMEQHGELSGLRRLRAFTMPDCHAFCRDLEQAKAELLERFELCRKVQQGIGFRIPEEFEFALRMTQEFWEQNQDFVKGLVRNWGKPALVEMWERRSFYFVFKYEWNYVDNLEKATALNTDQIDIENGERYDITFMDSTGRKQHPLILHCSPCGAVERVMYALLERAGFQEKQGRLPMLPLWLTPTQVRLIPVSIERHLEFCLGVQEEFSKLNIRADVDDRVESVGKRIRAAGQEWIPYVLVVGDNELQDKYKQLMVRDREKNEEYRLRFDQLVDEIRQQTKGLPYDPLPLTVQLSKRIIFVG